MLPRFRTIANLLKNKTDIFDFFEKQKASKLTKEEKEVLDERIKYAKLYLENYAEEKTENKKQFTLSENQKLFLKLLKEALEKMDNPAGEQIQNVIFSIIKENNLKAKEVFQGFYQVLTGKDFGPKAADLIIQLSIKKVLEKLRFNAI